MVTTHPLQLYREQHEPPLSKADLARLIKVSKTTIARWERGDRKIDLGKLSDVSEKTSIPKATLRPDLASLLDEAAA